MWGCGGDSAVQPHSMGGVQGGRGGTHTHTHTHTEEHTGTYTRMLHLPFSDLPLKKCPMRAKGTLISEPRFSTVCDMRFLPRDKERENGLCRAFFLENGLFLSRVGKIAYRRR